MDSAEFRNTTETIKNKLNAAYHQDENLAVEHYLALISLTTPQTQAIQKTARGFIENVRSNRRRFGGVDRFLNEFGLTTREGIALMCLAEALLRIPDSETADRMIRDKIGHADWDQHLGKTEDLFVNASTWALMLTGKVVAEVEEEKTLSVSTLVGRLVNRIGEPVVRQAMLHAMKIMGHQFVMGRHIEEGLKRAKDDEKNGYRHSYDMLGEGARTAKDATRYLNSYEKAIHAIGKAAQGRNIHDAPGISVKLSALHPRYEYAQRDICVPALTQSLLKLASLCAHYNIGLTVDAEEAHRLEISLEIIAAVFCDPALKNYQGFGLAIQAYQKRCSTVIDYLAALSREQGKRMMVRLVKGAYWDSEIKYAQVNGLPGYPVFTRKNATDVAYLACASKLLAQRDLFYPMFATHNAYTVAALLELAGTDKTGFEFQRLHGMGEPLYHQITGHSVGKYPCRIYAPVGSHQDLLPYLVRRLLENGANTNFVNRLQDDRVPIDDMLQDPVAYIRQLQQKPHPKIPLPADLFGETRQNSAGLEFANSTTSQPFLAEVERFSNQTWQAAALINGQIQPGEIQPVFDPANQQRQIGQLSFANLNSMEFALTTTQQAFPEWNKTPAIERATALRRMADLMETNRAELVVLCVREAGKTLSDAIAEVREAVDFCRYYAHQGESLFGPPQTLPGPTGESNTLQLQGRGVFLCISPWNFPLAIFIGQVSAALMAGNCVIAKPAEQTSLMAFRATQLLLDAGIPPAVIALLPAKGELAGRTLVPDARIAGVCFTGSTSVAHFINRTLAARDGAIVPLIAETGGQNAMIADSTSLPEQIVDDVITSAFRSAGQRCSALRVLFLQDGIADRVIEMLQGACAELRLGDPLQLATDIGPVIDQEALQRLQNHSLKMQQQARKIAQVPIDSAALNGTYFAPCAYEISNMSELEGEVFGPILHIIRFHSDELEQVIEQINGTGYGLTFGLHTRIDESMQTLCERISAGNCYVNRSMTGAVVGVQPFGGHGLSGTGPKAGGPNYLPRFASERTVTINITASGGNTSLVSLAEE